MAKSRSFIVQFFYLVLLSVLCNNSVEARVRRIGTTALSTCMADSQVSASTFDVQYTPDNNTLTFDIVGRSSVSGEVTVVLSVYAYGLRVVHRTLEPCSLGLVALCPIETGNVAVDSQVQVSPDIAKQIPGIAYSVPDLDGYVQIEIKRSKTETMLACLRADLSNGRSVDVSGVSWVTATVAGIAIMVSAIASGLGYSLTAAHVATNAVALFVYFQGQAIVGMLAVKYPPIVRSWTQNFQWAMGVIRVGWMQKIFSWYVNATGGVPSTFLSSRSALTVVLQKRSLFSNASTMVKRAISTDESSTVRILSGIDRVAYSAGIETTSLFITSITFFFILLLIAAAGLLLFKGIVHLLSKSGKIGKDKFVEFRQGWRTVLKGVMFRLILIGYPQMTVLCLWELTHRDSAGCLVLALSIFCTMTALLGYAAFRVIRLARRSLQLHKNAAYILFSDPKQLSRWGFLYVQFRATAYYFVVPLLLYFLLKGLFAGLGQGSQMLQAIAFIGLEGAYFGLVVSLRPFMDKRTNAFNIAIVTVNLVNSIFILIFTGVFGIKGIANGIMGVAFFALNAVFSTILLILVICSCVYALFAKNPDVRYQRMTDERNSYMKSKMNLDSTTELTHLPVSGESKLRKEMFTEADITEEYTKEAILKNASPVFPSTPVLHGSESRSQLVSPASGLVSASPGVEDEHAPLYPPARQGDARGSRDTTETWNSGQRSPAFVPGGPITRNLSPSPYTANQQRSRSPAPYEEYRSQALPRDNGRVRQQQQLQQQQYQQNGVAMDRPQGRRPSPIANSGFADGATSRQTGQDPWKVGVGYGH